MLKVSKPDLNAATSNMRAILERQKRAHLAHGPLSLNERTEWIDRLIALLVDNSDAIADTISRDFGNRTRELSLLGDVAGSIGSLKYARAHLKEWMRPAMHDGGFPDAKAAVEYMPLGVVGVLSPWNFPVNLTFAPLASIIAAGNRAMIKPSELTPRTSLLIARLIGEAFDEREIAVVLGDTEVAVEFSKLRFDHMLYTGSTAVGRQVMRAAADGLVPVTLELGGKCPVIVSATAPIADAAARMMTIKTLNAGQICLAPDYVLLPEEQVEPFVTAARFATSAMFPTLLDNPDYTSIINERHELRLRGLLEDAKARGARIIEINPASETFGAHRLGRRMAPALVVEPPADCKLLADEIFGPILPILTYKTIDDAIAYVNARERPLALYYFGTDAAEERHVLDRTLSGGVTVNDIMAHASCESLPFGGVGASGIGAYHGKSGFINFSHARAIFHQSEAPEAEYALRAPFGEPTRQYLAFAISK